MPTCPNADGTDRTVEATDRSMEAPGSDILRNPVLRWTLQQFPEYTKGEILFFMLPLKVRHRIYSYHDLLFRSTVQTDEIKRKFYTPLSQTCRTFRREIRGLFLSRFAWFTNEHKMQKHIGICRKQYLSPFVSSITFDITSPDCPLRPLETLRRVLGKASQEFKFINTLSFCIQSAHEETATQLIQLMEDGTIEQFTRLETVRANDLPVQKRYKGYSEEDQAEVWACLRLWMAHGSIHMPANTELLAVARCILRLKELNGQLNAKIKYWRRDSGVDLEDGLAGDIVSPHDANLSST